MKPAVRVAQRNLESMMATRHHPKCFESRKEYEEWLDHEAIVNTTAFRRDICEDCTNAHQGQMVREGRCANPQVVLVEDIYKVERRKKSSKV
jgi:hypothetical protein